MDYITYSTDTLALIAEAKLNYPTLVSEAGDAVGITKTPTVRNGDQTMALVRDLLATLTTHGTPDEDGNLPPLENLSILLECEDFNTFDMSTWEGPERDIYDAVYPREYSYTDEDGKTIQALKPEKIGVFA